MTTLSILIPAAGCGSRAGAQGNKILALLHEKPLLWWTLRALTTPEAFPAGTELLEFIIAARQEEFSLIEPLFAEVSRYVPGCDFCLVEGGATRQNSVYNAARSAHGDLLIVHDAARPFVSAALLDRVIQAALSSGAALAALPCSDTVKRAAPDGTVEATIDRSTLWLAQTPQIFRRELFLTANAQAEKEGFAATDCASLVERLPRQAVSLVPGEVGNFKVTYPSDLERAAQLFQNVSESSTFH